MKKILPFLIVLAATGSALAATPTITSISPSSCLAGSPQFALTVNGTNFVNGATVNWNGTPLTTAFVSSTKLIAVVPAANVATAGTAQVTAKNPTGSPSNAVTFTINNPVPTITSLNPSSSPGCGQFTLTVNGTNFVSTSTVKWNATTLATTFVSSTQLTATVTAALVASPGTASVTVVNPPPGGGTSNAQTFTINVSPAPVITSPLTATGTVGTAFSYQITATNCPASYNATPLPPVLSVNTSTGLISGTPTTAGVYSVTISATNAGGTGTATLVITINNPVPTTTSISPNCVMPGSACFTLTVTGTNFVSGSVVMFGGTSLTPTSSSSTQLTVTVPASLVAIAGTASITVVNPGPGGGTSNAQTFTIAATPVITSPLTACGTKGVAFSYTITATNSPTSFTASPLPAGLSVNTSTGVISGTPTATGTTNVTITARNGAGTCNTATATLVITIGTTPTISSLSPTCTGAGGPQFTLTVNGPNNDFTQGETVYWNGSPLVTTFVSSKLLTAIVTTDLIANAGTASITVVSSCGGTSNAVTFTIDAAPSITSALTASATVGTPFSYQITANNNPVSYNATGLPGGLTVDTTTGIISGTPTAAGTFPVTISATNNANDPCSGTATDTLQLAVTFPSGFSIAPFLGQVNAFPWGTTQPGPNDTIPFPNASTGNSFVLYWNPPGTNTNPRIVDSPTGGLQRNQ